MDAAPGADVQIDRKSQAHGLRRAMNALPAPQRIAIELAFFQGLTHAEIARQLMVPLGTVKTRVRQGLLNLRDSVAEEWCTG